MNTRRALAWAILLVAVIMAFGHAPLAVGISSLFRPSGGQPPPPSGQSTGGGFSLFPAIGAYFLIATVAYLLGGIFVVSGRLFKLANLGLIALAIIDKLASHIHENDAEHLLPKGHTMVLGLVPFGNGADTHRPKYHHRSVRHPSLQIEIAKSKMIFSLRA